LGILLDYGSGSKPKKEYKTSDMTGSPRFDFHIQNYRVQDLENGEVDSLHCRNVIHHIRPEDLKKVFREFERLVRKGGKLIISEPMEKYFIQNKILDLIWYRFLYYDRDIYLPREYVDFKDFIDKNEFKLLKVEKDNKNEVLTYKRM